MQKLYREVTEPKRGKISDLMLIAFAVVIILLFEPALVFAGFPSEFKITAQSVFCLFLIFFCIYFYRKRLRSFRYTYITDREDVLGSLEDMPEGMSELAQGTFIAESIVGGGAGTVIAVITPEEIMGLYSPEEQFPEIRASHMNASLVPSKKAYGLLYNQGGKVRVLHITPSKELMQVIKESNNKGSENGND